jgi:thiamine biosynthesis lipoprotein
VRDACVATSADDQTTFSNDHVHHHIFDPHTGYSPRDVSSVTVIAPTCIQADALTKVLFVAGFERAIALADQWQVQALVVSKSGECQMTKGLPVV